MELMRLVEDHARDKGLGKLSVATLPGRFAKMYNLLQRRGWEEMTDEVFRSDGKGGVIEEKMVLIKAVEMESQIGVAK